MCSPPTAYSDFDLDGLLDSQITMVEILSFNPGYVDVDIKTKKVGFKFFGC